MRAAGRVSRLIGTIKVSSPYIGYISWLHDNKSVNKDDVGTYHLFYADERGTPGTDVTFFDLPRSRPLTEGTNSISNTALRVRDKASLKYWQARLEEHDVNTD